MNSATLARLCKLWQKRLRLQDWSVTVILTDESEMIEKHGDIDWDVLEMTATVRIRISPDTPIEATMIHELLHLRVIPFGVDDNDEKQTSMNLLADCFMRAYPRKKERCTTVE